MANKIQLRRDTTANWERINPILADGEPGLDITLNKLKMGDGTTTWHHLPYLSSSEHTRLVNGSNVLSVASNGAVAIPGTITFPNGTTNSGSTVIAPGVYDVQSIGNTLIQTSANAGAKTWTFDTSGTLTLPDAGKVKVGTNVDITVETTDGTSTYDWVFGGNGITTVPGRIQGRAYTTIGNNSVTGIEQWSGAGANAYVWFGGSNFNTLYNLGSAAVGWKMWGTGGENNKATITAIDTSLGGPSIILDGPLYGTAPYTAAEIVSGVDPIILGNTNRWQFNPDGTLTLPSSTVNTAFNAEVYFTNDHWQTVFEAYDTTHNGGDGDKGKGPAVILDLDSSAVSIRAWGTSKTWQFNGNGNLYLPVGGYIKNSDGVNLATESFVSTAVADLVASAPSTLNTLKELSDALGSDANFATTVTNALAAKAPLTSPALTTPSIAGKTVLKTGSTSVADEYVVYLSASATTANQVLDTLATASYTSVRYTIEAKNSVGTEIVEITLTYEGTTPYINATTLISTVTPFQATYDADVTGGNLRLLVTPTNINTQFKVRATAFKVI